MTERAQRLYAALVADEDDHTCRDLPESACREVPGNAVRLVAALTLQKLGDRIADPKTVLAWMLSALGAPAFAIALLVPVREAGALLPQAALVPFVQRFGRRSRAWSLGALGQGLAVCAMAVAGLGLEGLAAGLVVLGALALFALARALASITAKDVLGKTVPQGNRGSVTGIASSVAGLAAIGAGLVLALFARGEGPSVLAWAVGVAALFWLLAAGAMASIVEHDSAGGATATSASLVESLALLRDDRPFRRFVAARSCLLVTALSPPFVVANSASVGASGVSGVGPFVIATGVAGLLAAPIWGRLADRSARLVMVVAAPAAGATVLVYLALCGLGLDASAWLGPATYLALAVLHQGARMGRKTYVVDLGSGDTRTRYVAVSNSILGVLLLGVGGLGAGLAQVDAAWTLALLALAGIVGGAIAWTLPEAEE